MDNLQFAYTDDRFTKLSKKIANLQNLELNNTFNYTNAESKLDYLEHNILKSIKDYEYKYKFLHDEINYLNKLLEEEKNSKESIKNKIKTEIINFEQKIKNSFEKERENMKLLIDNMIISLETEIIKMQKELDLEKQEILTKVKDIKNFIEIDLPKFNNQIDECSDNRNLHVKNIIASMNEELKYFNNLVFFIFNLY